MDVLFCTVCMASMILFYSPIKRQTHSALTLMSVALLVTPVANNPTDSLNIICAIAGSVTLSFLLWLNYILVVNKCTLTTLYNSLCCRSNGRVEATVSRRKRPKRKMKYTFVPSSDPSGDSQSDPTANGIELTASQAMDRGNVFLRNRDQADVESSFVSVESRYSQNSFRDWELYITNCILDLPDNLYDCKFALFGLLLAGVGLAFFVLQTRESYWFMHSMWHMCVMLSSYCLIRGRFDFFNVIEHIDEENPPFIVQQIIV